MINVRNFPFDFRLALYSHVSLHNLLGQEVDLDEGILRKGDVDARRQVNSSRSSNDEVKRETSTNVNLSQTRNLDMKCYSMRPSLHAGVRVETYLNGKLGGSDELDGLSHCGSSGQVDLDVHLHTTKVDPQGRVEKEAVLNLDGNSARDGSLGEAKAEVDGIMDTFDGRGRNTICSLRSVI